MAAISGNYWTLAIGKQTAKGSPQETPTYKLKATGGDIAPVRGVFTLAETDSSRQQGADVIVSAHVAGAPEFYLRPNDFGLWAYALLGANADSGSSPNYTHIATPADTGPYLTLFKAIGGTVLVDRYDDCRVTSMRVRGQAGQPLTCAIDIMGLNARLGSTDPVLAVVTQAPLVYPQVTVTIGGSAPGTVESFDVNIANNGVLIQADKKIQAYDYVWGELQVSGTFTLLFENDTDYRTFHTGSASGTALSTDLMTKSLNILAQVTSVLSVAFDMDSVSYTEYPVPPDPGGAPIRVAVGFRSQPSATIANYIEITTKNTVASY